MQCRERAHLGNQTHEKTGFCLRGTAALTLAACGSNNQDQVSNAELNQPARQI